MTKWDEFYENIGKDILLGEGGNGKVFKVKKRGTDEVYALKELVYKKIKRKIPF